MPAPTLSPSELRNMFGANLRTLAQAYPSISELSRQLRINRTQFNRYLSGESFPRPDVLARICEFFEVDARVLLDRWESSEKTAGPHPARICAITLARAFRTCHKKNFRTGCTGSAGAAL